MHAIKVVTSAALRAVSIGVDRDDRILGIGRAAGSVDRRRLDGEGLVDIAVRVRRHVHRALHRLVEREVRGDEVDGELAAGGVVAGRIVDAKDVRSADVRSEEHTSELQSLMRSSYAVFCLKK